MTDIIYDTSEDWLKAFTNASRPYFDEAGYSLPYNLLARIGYPTTGERSSVAGQCIAPSASKDGSWNIFISPKIVREGGSAARIADILTHELCHTVVSDASGPHGKNFGKLARALGLEGPLTSTYGGAAWHKWAAPILTELGPMPDAEINLGKPKTKPTFQRKVECPDCGWYGMVSAKWIDAYPYLTCPVPDCGSVMIAHSRKN